MADDEHISSGEKKGLFTKVESSEYRATCEGCGKGYHGNRWDAHHLLPGVVFTDVKKEDEDGFFQDCLNATDYDINKDYSMAGLPKLTAFILYFQRDPTMPFDASQEKQVTMLRWGTVKKYKKDRKERIKFPGDFPVHNPVNYGHTQYNKDVLAKLMREVFNKLRKKKKKNEHFKPQDLKGQITSVKDFFWSDLQRRGKGPGCAGKNGIEANLRARYDADNEGWWKPLCMADVPEPASP
jgi:hypothetical protein